MFYDDTSDASKMCPPTPVKRGTRKIKSTPTTARPQQIHYSADINENDTGRVSITIPNINPTFAGSAISINQTSLIVQIFDLPDRSSPFHYQALVWDGNQRLPTEYIFDTGNVNPFYRGPRENKASFVLIGPDGKNFDFRPFILAEVEDSETAAAKRTRTSSATSALAKNSAIKWRDDPAPLSLLYGSSTPAAAAAQGSTPPTDVSTTGQFKRPLDIQHIQRRLF